MKRIVLTGGGTAGHVTPNIALLPSLLEQGYDVHYIGSYDGIEKSLMTKMGIPYSGISSGKLRRYFSLENFKDPFKVIKGFREANKLMKELKPDVLFSKGGFVSVPVVYAARRNGIPAIIHESDMTPGLANKLCFSKARHVCCNFPETVQKLPSGKAVLTGSPIRKALFEGSREAALRFCKLDGSKPIILIIGGSLGAQSVNKAIRSVLPELLAHFDIIHLCGKGKTDDTLNGTPGYVQFEYIDKELPDLFCLADLIISRAGANTICEILALRKPNLLIPLPAKSSRGDQLLNARSFEKQGFSMVLEEEDLTDALLLSSIRTLYKFRDAYAGRMEKSTQNDAIRIIIDLINKCAGKPRK